MSIMYLLIVLLDRRSGRGGGSLAELHASEGHAVDASGERGRTRHGSLAEAQSERLGIEHSASGSLRVREVVIVDREL